MTDLTAVLKAHGELAKPAWIGVSFGYNDALKGVTWTYENNVFVEDTHFSHWVAMGTHTSEDGLCVHAISQGGVIKWTKANCDADKAEVFVCEKPQINHEIGEDAQAV